MPERRSGRRVLHTVITEKTSWLTASVYTTDAVGSITSLIHSVALFSCVALVRRFYQFDLCGKVMKMRSVICITEVLSVYRNTSFSKQRCLAAV